MFGLISLVVSKEQKVSEFCQQWIDSLREEVAAFIAHCSSLSTTLTLPAEPSQEHWQMARPDLHGMNESAARIRLRLNSQEADSLANIKCLGEAERLFEGIPNVRVPNEM